MAEILVVAGAFASFASIAKVASHLVQGCLSLRQLMKDAKNATETTKKLIQELETLSKTAEGIERIAQGTENEELREEIAEAVGAPLEACVRAVEELRGVMTEYQKSFEQVGAKGWWKKVKAVKGEKAVSKLLGDIERTKSGLILAVQSVPGLTAQFQNGILGALSQSVEVVHNENLATSKKIDTSIKQGTDILNITKRTEEQIRASEIWQRQDSETVSRQLQRISTSQEQHFGQSLAIFRDHTNNVSTKIDSSMIQGQVIMSVVSSTDKSITELMRAYRENSERIQSMQQILEPSPAVMNSSAELYGLFMQALDTRDRSRAQKQIVEMDSSTEVASEGRNAEIAAPQSSTFKPGQKTRRKQVSYTEYLYSRYFQIESTSWEESGDDESSTRTTELSEKTETTRITIRSTLPFFMRAVHYTRTRSTWNPFFERTLRPVMVFEEDSAIFKACLARDVDKVSQLFTSGEASPFMEDQDGFSLFDTITFYLFQKDRRIDQKAVQFMNFMSKVCGSRGVDVLPDTMEELLGYILLPSRDRILASEEYDNSASILRIIFDRAVINPLDSPWIPSLIESDDTQNSLINTTIRQSQWPLDLSPTLMNGTVVENLRQMRDDPNGDLLKRLLENADSYSLRLADGYPYGKPLSNLLELVAKATDPGIRYCCKNRLKLLIGTPKFYRFTRPLRLDFDEVCVNPIGGYLRRGEDPTDYYLGRYAIRNGYRPLLEDMFRDLERQELDINDFFDKDTFYCVPELLDGQIVFQTSQQAQKEFIVNLCDGSYSKASRDEIDLVARGITCTYYSYPCFMDQVELVSIIRDANEAFTLKNMPGSWSEEFQGKSQLVPGVDFKIDHNPLMEKRFLSWYHDYINSGLNTNEEGTADTKDDHFSCSDDDGNYQSADEY